MPMITKKIWSALLLVVMLALAGCPVPLETIDSLSELRKSLACCFFN
jgi:hypothetical protein